MDTIENNEPAGSDDVTSSPDTSPQVDTQTSAPESVDGGSPEPAEGNASETLLAGKFKDPGELEKGYKELESKLGELGQKASVADLIQEKYGLTPEQLRAQVEQLELQQRQERYANDPLAPLVDEMQILKETIQAQEAEKAEMQLKGQIDSFLKANPAYEANREQITKLAQTPGIGYDPITGEDLGSIGDIAQEYFGNARAQGQQDAYNKIEVKENTQATGISNVSKNQLSADDLKSLSVAELEAILPHSDNQYM